MRVTRISNLAEMAGLTDQWNCLARGIPFRSWQWLHTWWRLYQAQHELFVLAVHNADDTLVGLAPWYLDETGTQGRILRYLGSGKVCSDYMTVLSTPEYEDSVTEAIGNWLIESVARGDDPDCWDFLELDGTATTDLATAKLIAHLSQAGCSVHRRPDLDCWQLNLPDSWEELRASFSKNGRKRLKRLQRTIDENDVRLQVARSESELQLGMSILIDLHQKRRAHLGQPGCAQFASFLDAVADYLWKNDKLQLTWIVDGANRPLASEFSLLDGESVFLYQSGIEPDALELSPGHLITLLLVWRAIKEGKRRVDFLRGEEGYKSTWGAKPQQMIRIRVASNRLLPRVRQGVWLAGYTMKNWVRSGLNLTGMVRN